MPYVDTEEWRRVNTLAAGRLLTGTPPNSVIVAAYQLGMLAALRRHRAPRRERPRLRLLQCLAPAWLAAMWAAHRRLAAAVAAGAVAVGGTGFLATTLPALTPAPPVPVVAPTAAPVLPREVSATWDDGDHGAAAAPHQPRPAPARAARTVPARPVVTPPGRTVRAVPPVPPLACPAARGRRGVCVPRRARVR